MLYKSLYLLYLVPASYFVQDVGERPQVEVEYEHGFDFSQLDSFAWSTEQQPAPSRADHIRITNAVSGELEERGFTPDTKNPDVRVLYGLEVEQKKLHVDSRQRESVWDPTDLETTISLSDHQEETYLVVEMFDSETGRSIWRAKCAHPQPTPDKVEKSIYETVKHLFEVYPANEEQEH